MAACSAKGEQGEGAARASASASVAAVTVSCALHGAADYKDRCTVEHSASGGKNFILLRHPDGGFRRLEELEAGKRYKTIDGADEAVVEANGSDLELTVGDDHYLFPLPQPTPGQNNAPHS